MDTLAIDVDNLTKIYPKVKAVDGIKFAVAEGEIFGLLGPNGAGKTTTIKMLMTLTPPSAGTMHILGIDAQKNPTKVRELMGYVPQEVSVDGDLTGYENLLIYSKLCYVNAKERKDRIKNALDYMGLTDRSNDIAKHYSGGMMRRLEIAQALVNHPKILFLDEPSIGLDPAARRQVWQYIRDLNKTWKTTILLTTHDMQEADELCNRIAIIDGGKIVKIGTPTELKQSVGGDIVQITPENPTADFKIPAELGTLLPKSDTAPTDISILTPNGAAAMPKILQIIASNGIIMKSIALNRPTLDDVFLKYTHTRMLDAQTVASSRTTRRSFKSHAR